MNRMSKQTQQPIQIIPTEKMMENLQHSHQRKGEGAERQQDEERNRCKKLWRKLTSWSSEKRC